jgi:calcineurin-like phosphoesterase family protein
MRKIFFTSDTHSGHGNIIKYCARNKFLADIDRAVLESNGGKWHDGEWKGRGSSSWRISEESINNMDDTIIENINNTVGKDDILYHLGDFCFAPKNEYFEKASSYRKRINCKEIHFLFGNHDKPQIKGLFNSCHDILDINVNGQKITLCHYAMLTWNGSHRGSICLYGHSHSNLEEYADKIMPGRRAMDVGIDNAAKLIGEYRPFSFDEIIQILSTKKGFSCDHHKGPTEEELIG